MVLAPTSATMISARQQRDAQRRDACCPPSPGGARQSHMGEGRPTSPRRGEVDRAKRGRVRGLPRFRIILERSTPLTPSLSPLGRGRRLSLYAIALPPGGGDPFPASWTRSVSTIRRPAPHLVMITRSPALAP